jgi:hypothetical protein
MKARIRHRMRIHDPHIPNQLPAGRRAHNSPARDTAHDEGVQGWWRALARHLVGSSRRSSAAVLRLPDTMTSSKGPTDIVDRLPGLASIRHPGRAQPRWFQPGPGRQVSCRGASDAA